MPCRLDPQAKSGSVADLASRLFAGIPKLGPPFTDAFQDCLPNQFSGVLDADLSVVGLPNIVVIGQMMPGVVDHPPSDVMFGRQGGIIAFPLFHPPKTLVLKGQLSKPVQ